ncbi:hypothetical protein QBC47DRAFT_401624 [Echria macrotheca]|uniref:Peptidase S8/S53 domain-containing protein n=1 Tax=Echria macrotheca TaxID=438768 RepID=A0AAJ0BCR1_9PEZI|nr:hypothetical protein QBC47DRAFT_401624 [Echria macrotheca]
MPRLFECDEWRLLQALGGLLAGRQAKVQFQRGIPEPADCSHGHPNYEFLEVELRRTFLPRDSSRNLSADEFELLHSTLRTLCALLENSVVVEGRPTADSEGLDPYARLRRLVAALAESTDIVDLLATPDKPRGIFDMSAQVKRNLDTISECNDTISRLLSSQATPLPQPPPKSKERKPWKDCEKRRRAAAVLQALFRRVRCGKSHELVMRGLENANELQCFLSSCLSVGVWRHVRCTELESGPAGKTVSIITSICEELEKPPGQGMSLSLLIEAYGVFGAWTPLVSASTESPSPEETLNGLIAKGAFEPALRFDTFKAQDPSFVRFSPLEMRKLAVELGYLLMDFFDAHLSAERIYFLRQPGNQHQRHQPCVAFSSNLHSIEDLQTFQIGHPTLLSFAKLLLELYSGAAVKVRTGVSPKYNQNNQLIWLDLSVYLERLEKDQGSHDSFLKAIRGCLQVHQKISETVLSKAADGERDMVIRKALYRKIVWNLEQSVAEATPRARHKRQRSQSPPGPVEERHRDIKPISTKRYRGETTLSLRQNNVEISRGRTLNKPDLWRRRTEGSDGALFDDTTPPDFPPNLCHYADSFMETQVALYDDAIYVDIIDDNMRIKVAVLDTGLDIGHPRIQASRERIRDTWTWLDAPEGKKQAEPNDPCGHGTHVTGLLLDTAPDCDVYVAQIADSRQSRPISASMIARAVIHAVDVWGVGIISMSFGFPDENEAGCGELRDAILTAFSKGVLMFAAASNSGVHKAAPAFPARLSSVFCIYSGDGVGNSAPTNPNPRKNRHNFMTLGEAVESAWPRSLCSGPAWKARKSGTSFATPIAAGIAAFLLLYAMQNLPPDEAQKLRQFDKMEDLLFHLSNESRNRYNVLTLGEFFQRPAEQRNSLLLGLLEGKPWKV